MLRAMLTVAEFWIAGERAAEAKRRLARASLSFVFVLAGAVVANLCIAGAVFLAVQPALAPHWAALAAAGAALALPGALVGAIAWRGAQARARAANVAAASADPKTENAILIGTLAAAFLSGIASGAGRRPSAPLGARD